MEVASPGGGGGGGWGGSKLEVKEREEFGRRGRGWLDMYDSNWSWLSSIVTFLLFVYVIDCVRHHHM